MLLRHRSRVVVGLSGGVDSSAAAALLLEHGHDVVGVHLQMRPPSCRIGPFEEPAPSGGLADARRVCDQLGIPFQAVDCTEAFQREVIAPFAAEYRAGRTPNPCVLCNRHIKFATLLQTARELGADYIATGHYACIQHPVGSGRHLLRRAQDTKQDQTYFLFAMTQEELACALFPLGEFTKANVRALACARGLPTAEKRQSQEICFIPDNDYGRFLLDSGLATPRRGEIVNRQGRILGRHDGIELFTVGQRRGLRIAAPRPLYVLELDPARNRVVVGEAEELASSAFQVERCNWVAWPEPPPAFQALAKIRYQHKGASVRAECLPDGALLVHPQEPQRAVTPGQACVFYQDDLLLGGGWIASARPV